MVDPSIDENAMIWPWVSRARFDDAAEQVRARLSDAMGQVEHLRAEVDRLTDALVRIGRSEAGLSEEPRQPRPAPEPMPDELVKYIAAFGNRTVRREMTAVAWRRHVRGTPWATIVAEVMAEEQTE
jgi:hypothetical protein